MKNVLIAIMLMATVMTGCGDDGDTGGTPTPNDIRENILGEYTCDYKVFSRTTLVEKDKGSFTLKIYKNSDDADVFDFRQDGLIKFMSGSNLKAVSGGYSFEIPQQDVEGFGNIKGVPITNVPDQTERVAGYCTTQNNTIVVYCERAKQGDDDLFEFTMVKK